MQPHTEDPFVLLNDEPVSSDDDLLGTSDTARGLAELIVASRSSAPFTLAINAGWGMGKSSLMRQMQRHLDQSDGTTTVWFNAWTSGANALEVLIKSVLLRFDRNIIRRGYHRLARNNRSASAVRIIAAVVLSMFGLRRLVDALWSQMSVDAKSRHDIQEGVRSIAQDWVDTTGTSRQQIVVFVDDLDRCSFEVVTTVCEVIKLYLDVPGLVFVLACDQAALSRTLRQGSLWTEPEYLEKIIQVNYYAPVPDQEKVRDLIRGYAQRCGASSLFEDELRTFVAERTRHNPRRIKRLINSVVLEYHLDPVWPEFGADILVRVLLVQQFYPGFYRLLLTSHRSQDPVDEFLAYQAVRRNIRLGESFGPHGEKVFTSHGIEPPTTRDAAEALGLLEQELPEPMASLAPDEEFGMTLRHLREFSGYHRLRQHLRNRQLHSALLDEIPYPISVPDELSHSASVPDKFSYSDVLPDKFADLAAVPRGTRVLVVDDVFGEAGWDFSDAGMLAKTLREWGMVVETADGWDRMVRSIRSAMPDVIVSDIRRGDRDNAGLEDLQILRDQGLYRGPVVFFAARVTPARRRRADELGAIGVTNTFTEVLEWVRMAAGEQVSGRSLS